MADTTETSSASQEQGLARPRGKLVRRVVPAALALIAAANLSIAIPVGAHLSGDPRNAGVTLVGYRALGVHPTETTLDLWSIGADKAPIDLLRTLFHAAEALKDRRFSRVVLARHGRALFTIDGADFQALGQAYAAGENPIYLIRTLPEKLRRMDGSPAFNTWEGGWLGVMSGQMEDISAMSEAWVSGSAP